VETKKTAKVIKKTKRIFRCNECAVDLLRKDPNANLGEYTEPCEVSVGDDEDIDIPTECVCKGEDYGYPALWQEIPSEEIPLAERDYSHFSGKTVLMMSASGKIVLCIVAYCDYSVGITIKDVNTKSSRLCLNGRLSVNKDNYAAFAHRYDEIFEVCVAGIESGLLIDGLIAEAAQCSVAGPDEVSCATGL